MITIKRTFSFINVIKRQSLLYSTTVSQGGFNYVPKFSEEDQKKVLDILNGSNAEQLSRFDLSQGRIKSLESWKNKKGPFKSISEILEVDGLGVKNLERFCESIIVENNTSDPTKTSNVNSNNKNRRNFIAPNLLVDFAHKLTSAVGLHLDPTGISWAKLCTNNNQLSEWDFFNFSNLPKKLLPHETFDLAMNILTRIPIGDIYILESPMNVGPAGQKSLTVTYTHNLELTSMLLALINTSHHHNLTLLSENKSSNIVYYLKSKLSARLFRTLVGNERVSSSEAVVHLLKNSTNTLFPCSNITHEDPIKDFYYSQSTGHKDLLGQALLITITFMDLCIYKNEISIKSVTDRRR